MQICFMDETGIYFSLGKLNESSKNQGKGGEREVGRKRGENKEEARKVVREERK